MLFISWNKMRPGAGKWDRQTESAWAFSRYLQHIWSQSCGKGSRERVGTDRATDRERAGDRHKQKKTERSRLHKAEVERWGSGERPTAGMLGQTSGEVTALGRRGPRGPGPRNPPPCTWWTNEAPHQLPGCRAPGAEADLAHHLSPGQGSARRVQPWGFCSGLGWRSPGPWAAPKEGAGSPSHVYPGASAWKAASPRLGNRRPGSPGSFLLTSCGSGARPAQEGKQCCLWASGWGPPGASLS